MSNYAKVKDEKGLIRDMNSKAILNVDSKALNEHRNKKQMMKGVIDNSHKINRIEDDILEIKQLLAQLINTKAQ